MTTVPLRRNRPFAFFWVAQLLSNAGSQISELAIPLTAVLLLDAGPGEMGALTALEAAPSLVLGLFLGVLVDRVRRARLMFWCNVAQGVLIASIPVAAWLDVLSMPQVYVVTFLAGGMSLAYALAHTAYIPVLVTDRRQLAAANSSVSLTDSVTAVAGPGLGGLLVQVLTAPVAVFVDAVSFFVAAILQLLGRRTDPVAPVPGDLRLSLGEGWRAFVRQRGVFTLTVAKGAFDFFQWGSLALFVLYAVEGLGLSAAQIGLIAMLASLGPLLAGAITAPVSRRFGTTWTCVLAAVLLGGNLLTPLAAGPKPLVIATIVAGEFLLGLGIVYLIIVRATLLQQSVPAELLGRVGGVMRLIEWGPGPLGALFGGLLGELIGLRPALFVIGAGCLIAIPMITPAALRHRFTLDESADPAVQGSGGG